MAFTGAWWVVVAMRWIQGVVFQTLGKSSAEIYYMALRPHERRRIKPAVDTLVERWSDAVVGVLLIVLLGAMGASTTIIAATTAAFVAVWVVVLFLLNREYGSAFEQTLSSRWLEPDVAEDSLRLPAARRALLQELRGEDETRTVLALKLSEGLRDAEIAHAVRGCLRHPSPAVRAASVGAMEAMGLQDSEGIVEGFLGEPHEGLRRAAVGYLLTRGARPVDFARRMLDGEDATLRQYTVDALFDNPSEARTALTLTWVDARLETGAREDLLLAARALGAMAGSAPVARLRALLTNPDFEVRRVALLSAVRRPSRELLDVLLPLLLVPELSYEARRAVTAVGAPAVPELKRLLDGEQGARGQALAARTLARIASPRAVGALMALVKSREPRLRDHGFQSMTRVRVETDKPVLPRSVSHKLFLRELADYRRYREPALWLEGAAAPEVRLLADTFHESAEMALLRALGALACWYEPKPLSGSFERLKSPEAGAAAPAMEYLGHVLPHSIFRHVSKIFEEKPASDREGAVAEGERLAESIRVAWRSEDRWVRACAVRASRHAPALDPSVFADGGGDDPLVLAELTALPGGDQARSSGLTAVERVLILKGADLLNDVGPRHLLGLAGVAREVRISKGDTVYGEDDPADALYMVVAGRVRLSTGGRTTSEVGPGEAFGTWSLVDDLARGHRAACLEDGLTLALRRDEFYEMAAGDLVLLQEVVRGLAKRLRTLVVERPDEARVEGEGVEKTESVVQAETTAAESATAPAATPAEATAPPPTKGASLTAAALGRPQPEGEGPAPGASPMETPGENLSTDIIAPEEPPPAR
jgi:CRP-like cAMP-binding protein